MSVLRLQLHGTDSIAAAIAVEVVNADLETVAELSLSGHEQREVEVAPGKYQIRASLPSGEVIKVKTAVADSERKQVVLSPPVSSHSWLQWQHFLGNASSSVVASEQKQMMLSSLSRSGSLFQSTWMRLWTYHNQSWSVAALPVHESGQDQAVINYCLEASEAEVQCLRVLQLGGVQVPWRFVALPPASRLEILIRPAPEKADDEALTVAIASHNWNAETLLRYLAAGNLKSAKIVSQDLANAEALLAEKLTNPMGATIAGYYLLRIGAIDRLQNWAEHFANQFNWLPDALIIHAWQLLQQPQPNLKLAEQRLLQAADRGIPLYSRGLRLLFDGLQLFQKQSGPQPEFDRAIAKSVKTVQPYAAAIDWSQPLTTFHGKTPDRPLLSAPIGIPENSADLVWLPALEMKQDSNLP